MCWWGWVSGGPSGYLWICCVYKTVSVTHARYTRQPKADVLMQMKLPWKILSLWASCPVGVVPQEGSFSPPFTVGPLCFHSVPICPGRSVCLLFHLWTFWLHEVLEHACMGNTPDRQWQWPMFTVSTKAKHRFGGWEWICKYLRMLSEGILNISIVLSKLLLWFG